MKTNKMWWVGSFCLVAGIAVAAGAQQVYQRLYLYAGDVAAIGNGSGTDCDVASAPRTCIDGGNIDAGQGVSWNPSVVLGAQRGRGFMFFGPATFANNNGGSPAPITDCEGLNNDTEFQQGCDLAVYSSDSVGQLWLSAGPSGSQPSGRIAVQFNQTWPDLPICTVTPANLIARWTPGASAIVTPAPDQLTIDWSNAGSPLPYVGSGPGLGLNYHCFVLP